MIEGTGIDKTYDPSQVVLAIYHTFPAADKKVDICLSNNIVASTNITGNTIAQ
ncbi:MAG: hypothetical protein FIO03_04135 [Nitrosopumilales archaeon]|nr:hypothetical protein [Nitrosopumilales archaeon]